MEYGYYITDTAGNRRFFIEGCSYCHMSTGGLHEADCPLSKQQMREGYQEMGEMNLKDAEEFLPIAMESWPKWYGYIL